MRKPRALARGIALAVLDVCSLVLASAVGASAEARVVLTITPRDVVVDQPVAISVSGLRPRSTATSTAETRSAPGNLWKSTATFRADANGRVVVSRSPSLAGSYRGRDGMALLVDALELVRRLRAGSSSRLARTHRREGDDSKAVIPDERTAGPIFLVGAVMDNVWPSGILANQIVSRLKEHRRADYTSLVHFDAGHRPAT